MNMPVTVIRSSHRTIALQVRPSGEVIVRAPLRMPEAEIRRFIESRQGWIEKQRKRFREEAAPALPPYTPEDTRRLADEAARVIPERVRHFAPIAGVTYGRITIRNQKSKWGSCSAQGNLNFNCLLTDAPPEVLDYVVVHELCHRLHMDHSPAFWAEVARVLPDYRKGRQWLKENGPALIRRMTG